LTTTTTTHRRTLLIGTAISLFVPLVVVPSPNALAANSNNNNSNNNNDIVYERVRLGHARVRYLLDHWDDITSVCGTTIRSDLERKQIIRTENGNACTKTPLRVQEYMGYKSITDPIYRIDKVLVQESFIANSAVANNNNNNNNSDDSATIFLDYLEAVESYKEMADQTAMLAYTSSWGEANPYVDC
jgi:hypothetical protein